MAFEHVARICFNYDENTFDLQSTCYQTVTKFQISRKEMFSNAICRGLMENLDESAAVLIPAVFGSREHIDSPKVFWNRSLQTLKEPCFSESITCEIFKLWSWSSCSKCVRFYLDWKNAIKISENVSGFWDNGVWTCLWNFSELWQRDLWAGVNLLPECPKISHLTKRDLFQLNFSWLNGKLRWKCCRANFGSVCRPWTRWLSTSVPKRDILAIQVTTFLGVNNFRNI